MNDLAQSGMSMADLPALQRLLLAYAPARVRDWHGLCWLLDQRLAAVVRRGGDPMIAAIRLAWWDAVLVESDRSKGSGEPLIERWRAHAKAGAESAAERLIDGWRLLLSPEALSDEDLRRYGEARGGGLFGLIAARESAALDEAGALWALWDLAAHVGNQELAERALKVARELAEAGPPGVGIKPLRLARTVALPDVLRGRIEPGGFTLRHYGRLLLASLRR